MLFKTACLASLTTGHVNILIAFYVNYHLHKEEKKRHCKTHFFIASEQLLQSVSLFNCSDSPDLGTAGVQHVQIHVLHQDSRCALKTQNTHVRQLLI